MASSSPVHSLWRKLDIPQGAAVIVKNAPEPERSALSDLPEGAHLCDPKAERADVALVFVSRAAQVEGEAAELAPKLAPGAALFMAYPRGGGLETDLSPEHGWDPLIQAGWSARGDTALDETWSALRFCRAE